MTPYDEHCKARSALRLPALFVLGSAVALAQSAGTFAATGRRRHFVDVHLEPR